MRGLDYYNGTTFEISNMSSRSQNALLGGGRYDYLVESMGGPSTPAVGFAAGIERLLIESSMHDKNEEIDFFIGFDSHAEKAIKIAKKTGFQCQIFLADKPFDIIKTVCPIGGVRS